MPTTGTGVDLRMLINARTLLSETLPDETLRSGVAAAGIPRTFKPSNATAAH